MWATLTPTHIHTLHTRTRTHARAYAHTHRERKRERETERLMRRRVDACIHREKRDEKMRRRCERGMGVTLRTIDSRKLCGGRPIVIYSLSIIVMTCMCTSIMQCNHVHIEQYLNLSITLHHVCAYVWSYMCTVQYRACSYGLRRRYGLWGGEEGDLLNETCSYDFRHGGVVVACLLQLRVTVRGKRR